MKKVFDSFLELFFPRLCVCCETKLIEGEMHLCFECVRQLVSSNLLLANDKLDNLFAGRFAFVHSSAFALFVKGGNVQKIVHEFKYRDNHQLALYVGQLCGTNIMKNNKYKDIDYIVPVPLHLKRLKTRGYNQSEMIANGISHKINKPVYSDNLIRVINNPSQTKNSKFARWKNTEGIFDIKNKNIFENKHILLVDDVVTTGSTIEICAKLILGCKNSKLSIFAFAQATEF